MIGKLVRTKRWSRMRFSGRLSGEHSALCFGKAFVSFQHDDWLLRFNDVMYSSWIPINFLHMAFASDFGSCVRIENGKWTHLHGHLDTHD